MSNGRRHQWLRRLAVGFALVSIASAGCVSVAGARGSESGNGTAGVPAGESQPIDWQRVEVIPYLSHGILTEADRNAAALEATQDPYLTDVNVRPGESLGGPDGGPKDDRSGRGSEGDLSVDAPNDDDIGTAFVDDCRRLRVQGDREHVAMCMDYGALGGLRSDRD